MAKTDLQSAYRQVPVHREDQSLLGLEWRGRTYRDRALPFGLCSAPKLFTAVADSLAWAFQCNRIVNCVHYLDDFLFWGPPASPQCSQALENAISLCASLGLPVAPGKTVGPSTVLTFLGIEIDSVSQELRLPADKLSRLCESLSQWERKRNASKHELQVIIGLLNHAAAVVRPGRVLLGNLLMHQNSHDVLLTGCASMLVAGLISLGGQLSWVNGMVRRSSPHYPQARPSSPMPLARGGAGHTVRSPLNGFSSSGHRRGAQSILQ